MGMKSSTYVWAMNYGLARLPELPVSVRLIREIDAELLHGVRGGRLQPGGLRTSQDWIGSAGSAFNTATYVPPPPHVVPEALGALETFMKAKDDLPPLVKIALARMQFETIHPFLDGTGRVGRLMITFLLTERDVLHQPLLYLSHYFKRQRQEYYEHLESMRDRGDWESRLAFFLRGVIEAAGQAAEISLRILQLRGEHRAAMTTQLGRVAGNGHKVLEKLFDRPIVSVNDVKEITGTTYVAANRLVGLLVSLGVLSETTGYTRNCRFRCAPYIALFNQEAGA